MRYLAPISSELVYTPSLFEGFSSFQCATSRLLALNPNIQKYNGRWAGCFNALPRAY